MAKGKSSSAGDAKSDAALVRRGVHAHEKNMHKGKKLTKLKLEKK